MLAHTLHFNIFNSFICILIHLCEKAKTLKFKHLTNANNRFPIH